MLHDHVIKVPSEVGQNADIPEVRRFGHILQLSRQLARLAWLGDKAVANNNQVLSLLSANRIIAGGHRNAARLMPRHALHEDSGQVPGPQRGSKPPAPVIAPHRIDRAHSIRKRCALRVNLTAD